MSDKPKILTICGECGARPGEGCNLRGDFADCPEGPRAYVALTDLPEAVVEDLRAEHLELNTVDSTAEAAPDIPASDVGEAANDQIADALAHPISGDGSTPEEALG